MTDPSPLPLAPLTRDEIAVRRREAWDWLAAWGKTVAAQGEATPHSLAQLRLYAAEYDALARAESVAA